MKTALALLIACAVFGWYLPTPLGFSPVPSPDAAVLYLAGVDFWSGSHWLKSAAPGQSSVLPALPILFGLVSKMGLGRLHGEVFMTRALSLFALFAWAVMLWNWTFEWFKTRVTGRETLFLATLVAMGALLDPQVRMGTLVSRAEIWVGLCWLYTLIQIAKSSTSDDTKMTEPHGPWKTAIGVASLLYFHSASAWLLPAVALGLYPWSLAREKSRVKFWFQRVVQVGWRSLVLFSPWILFAFWNRISLSTGSVSTGHKSLDLFMTLGSPKDLPNYFVVGKVFFWLLVLILFNRTTWILLLRSSGMPIIYNSETSQTLVPVLTAGSAFILLMALHLSNSDPWLLTLPHLMLWPWAVTVLIHETQMKATSENLRIQGLPAKDRRRALPKKDTPLRMVIVAIMIGCAVLSFLASRSVQKAIAGQYCWNEYTRWVDCIERGIEASVVKSDTERKKIRQARGPDVLLELSHRHPDYELSHSMRQRGEIADVIITADHFEVPLAHGQVPYYEGPDRAEDRSRATLSGPPFTGTQICQSGPFWAELAFRK